MRTVHVIGIGGPSCSGKSRLAEHIFQTFQKYCPFTVLQFDHRGFKKRPVPSITIQHYSGDSNLSETKADFDTPDSYMFETFREVLTNLIHMSSRIDAVTTTTTNELESVEKFVALNPTFDNSDTHTDVIVIVEGFLLYYDQAISDLIQCKLFLDLNYETCKARRGARNFGLIVNNDTSGDQTTDSDKYRSFESWFDQVVWHRYLLYRPIQMNRAGVMVLDVSSDLSNGGYEVLNRRAIDMIEKQIPIHY